MKTLEKLSPEIITALRTNKDIKSSQNISQTVKFLPDEHEDEMTLQIEQYGPDTTVGDLIKMARNEKPVPLTLNHIRGGVARLFGWA